MIRHVRDGDGINDVGGSVVGVVVSWIGVVEMHRWEMEVVVVVVMMMVRRGLGCGGDDGVAADGGVESIGGGVHRLWRPEVSPERGDGAEKLGRKKGGAGKLMESICVGG
ncbi:hypothetical protein Tco_0839059 [Tanacetum coccineum]|uniref:Uncharacterized protein n=1 Tax=Tanacetum coccineum TaxID=301880 RepID=A0ABQ5ASE3_9ASTR